MLVVEAMTRGYQRVQPSDSIRTAARRMLERDIGMLLVEQAAGEVCGIITDRDITCRAAADGKGADTPVAECMSSGLISCRTEDDIYDAAELMKREQVRRLLVRDLNGKPVGVLSQGDVAQAIASYGLASEMVEAISQPGGKHAQH